VLSRKPNVSETEVCVDPARCVALQWNFRWKNGTRTWTTRVITYYYTSTYH